MPIFHLQPVEEIHGKIPLFKLVRDGRCRYDEFAQEIYHHGVYEGELDSIQEILMRYADGKPLPKTRFRKLKGSGKGSLAEYEVKTRHLRLYLVHVKRTGSVIILGGQKNTQPKDIKQFRRLKEEYSQHINI